MKKKMCVIIGTRPQYIKHAAIDTVLRDRYDITVVDTGQHYDDSLINIVDINIDFNLEIGSNTQSIQMGEMLSSIEDILLNENNFDYVLVYGDTNSALAGALAAAKLNIPVVHVEAGLRSFDMTMPEEINRLVIDRVSTYHYAPTDDAIQNLINEGYKYKNIRKFDIVARSLKCNIDNSIRKYKITKTWPTDYVLATIHRSSNVNDRFALTPIINALNDSNKEIVLPLHPNTKNKLIEYGLYNYMKDNIHIVDPVSYNDMLNMIYNSLGVITDSGGIQHECDLLNIPCITLRENTEWIESLERKNVLVGSDYNHILEELNKL